jgi:predicted nuclease of predicted toxin-antitoxin system
MTSIQHLTKVWPGATDKEVLHEASTEGRILFTLDTDF